MQIVQVIERPEEGVNIITYRLNDMSIKTLRASRTLTAAQIAAVLQVAQAHANAEQAKAAVRPAGFEQQLKEAL